MGPKPVDGQAVIGYVCSGDVPNVDDYVGKVTATGGKICVPKMPIPGVGWLAYATESEGIILGMMQSDPAAK